MIETRPGNRFKVGDRVIVVSHYRQPLAKVIEERGNLGVGGRPIVRIRLLPEEPNPEDDIELEIAEEDLRPAEP